MWTILDSTTRAAWFAATSQQGQLEALQSAIGASPRLVVLTSSLGELSRVTLGAPTINTGTTPRRLEMGDLVAGSFVNTATGAPGFVEVRTSGGTVILRAAAGTAGAFVNFAGPIRQRCAPSIGAGEVVVQANGSLPDVLLTYTVRQVETNGIITPGSQPSAWYRNGALYHGWVDASGNSGLTKYTAPSTQQRTILSAAPEDNSHNNCVIDWTADGRLVALWSRHNSTAGVQVRVASAVESVTGGFGSVVALTDSGNATSYVNTFRLSQNGKFYAASRIGASNPRPTKAWSTTDFSTWSSPVTWISDPAQRPYPKFLSDGVSRVHMVFSNGHPAEIATDLRYAYMQLDGSNVERFYRMDGTEQVGGATPSGSTQIVSNAAGRVWPYDMAFGPDGEIWVLYFRFPTPTDHRIMFVKSTGGRTGWAAPVEIATTGGSLYAAEDYSHAGAVFDFEDPTTIYLCRRDGGTTHKVERWTTSNNGASWSFGAVIQSNADVTKENFQVVSPVDHGGNLPVMYCRGTYTYWDAGFSTEQFGLVKD
jgi:hypothetical protein